MPLNKETKPKMQEENVSPSKLLIFGLKKECRQSKEVNKFDKSIFQGKDGATSSQQHIPLQVASAIFESGKMSKCMYTGIHLLLKGVGADFLSTYDKLDKFRKKHRPEVNKL